MKKNLLTAVSMLSLFALAAACAPAGSKTVHFKSGAPEEAGIAAGADQSNSLMSLKSEIKSQNIEQPAMRLIVKGKAAKAAFKALDDEGSDLLDPETKKHIGFKRQGKDISCAQIGLVEETATFSCEMPMYTDGTIGTKKSKKAIEREQAAAEERARAANPASSAPAASAPTAPAPSAPAAEAASIELSAQGKQAMEARQNENNPSDK